MKHARIAAGVGSWTKRGSARVGNGRKGRYADAGRNPAGASCLSSGQVLSMRAVLHGPDAATCRGTATC